MDKIIKKAGILVEALPYFRKFYGKTFVIKYGGSAMVDENVKNSIMEDITLLKYVGVNPVIVHGGGPKINETMESFNKKSEFVNGLRITDQETMEIVEMVLTGRVNKDIVSLINQHGGQAAGISAKDGGLIKAKKLVLDDNSIDLGFVGQVSEMNPGILFNLIDGGYIPVVAPVGKDIKGDSYNINADTVAGRLAASLKAEKLILLTDVDGIRAKPEEEESIVSSLKISEVKEWIEKRKIVGGMIPKVGACIDALSQGVKRTHILNGMIPHALLLEIFTDQGIGTMITTD